MNPMLREIGLVVHVLQMTRGGSLFAETEGRRA